MSKTKLNLYCQKSHILAATYISVKQGDVFVSEVTVNGVAHKSVAGHERKKEAEHDAASVALQMLAQRHSVCSVDDLLASVDGKAKQPKPVLTGQQGGSVPTGIRLLPAPSSPPASATSCLESATNCAEAIEPIAPWLQGGPKNPGAAPGNPGTAPGNPGTAPGNPGTAPGNPGTATGNPGTATGNSGTATGNPGTATGNPGTATGNPGTATGNPGTATGNPATATGNPATATRNPATAIGNPGTATGNSVTAPGYPRTAIGNPATAPGYPMTATGYSGTAPGYPRTAIGNPWTAPGYPRTAIGNPWTAPGYPRTATGNPWTAPGYPRTAIGNPWTAPGYPRTATGNSGTAPEYPATAATGNPGNATANHRTATGNPTIALGYHRTATGNPETAPGNPGAATGNPGTATGNSGTATGNSGNATGNSGNATGNPGTATGNPGTATGNPGNAPSTAQLVFMPTQHTVSLSSEKTPPTRFSTPHGGGGRGRVQSPSHSPTVLRPALTTPPGFPPPGFPPPGFLQRVPLPPSPSANVPTWSPGNNHRQPSPTGVRGPHVPSLRGVASNPPTSAITRAPSDHLIRQPSSASYDFDAELEKYCELRDFAAPFYGIVENTGRFAGRVVVDRIEYVGNCEQTTFLLARTNAALVALATLGIQALRVSKKVADVPTGSPALEKPLSAESGSFENSQQQQQQQQLQPPISRLLGAVNHSESGESGSFENSQQQQQQQQQQPQISRSLGGVVGEACRSAFQFLGHSVNPPPFSVVSAVVASTAQLQSPSSLSDNSTPVSFSSEVLSSAHSETQQSFQERTTTGAVSTVQAGSMSNYKVALNLYCQKQGIASPHYECTYPEDAVGYIAKLHVNGKTFSSKTEGTKRGAESTAASLALTSFGESVEREEERSNANGHSVEAVLQLELPSSISENDRNISYKTILQEYLQKSYIPVYETERIDAGFVCTVAVKVSPDEMQRYRGRPHPNKKAAEQESAKVACYHLKLVTQPL